MTTPCPFHYRAAGLSCVYLLNGVRTRDGSRGHSFHIQNIQHLHKTIASTLVDKLFPLTPNEFRFLRNELGLSRPELGTILGVSQETINGWEYSITSIPWTADASLRKHYLDNFSNHEYRHPSFSRVRTGKPREMEIHLIFSKIDGWQVCSSTSGLSPWSGPPADEKD